MTAPFPISAIAETEQEFLLGLMHHSPEHAEAELTLRLQRSPNHVDMWHALGHARRLQGKDEAAIDAYSNAIEMAARYHPIIHFEHSAMFLHRAYLHFRSGDGEDAARDIAQALFQDHINAPALHIKEHGWKADFTLPPYTCFAMTSLTRETELRRAPCTPHDLLHYQQDMDAAIALWHADNPLQAREQLTAITIHFPDNSLIWHRLALIEMELGNDKAALTHLSTALAVGASYHRAYHRGAALHYLHRGEMHENIRERELAGVDFTRAADMDTSFEEPRMALERIHTAKPWTIKK